MSLFLPALGDGNLSVLINPLGGKLGDAISVDYAKLTVVTAPVPEPGTLLLLASGLTGLTMRRRRRQS